MGKPPLAADTPYNARGLRDSELSFATESTEKRKNRYFEIVKERRDLCIEIKIEIEIKTEHPKDRVDICRPEFTLYFSFSAIFRSRDQRTIVADSRLSENPLQSLGVIARLSLCANAKLMRLRESVHLFFLQIQGNSSLRSESPTNTRPRRPDCDIGENYAYHSGQRNYVSA